MTQKPTYQQLEKQVRELTHALDHIDAYVFVKDRQGRYTFANAKVCKLFGVPLEQVLTHTDDSFFDLKASNSLRLNDQKVIHKGEVIEKEESNVISSTGENRIYWTVKKPLRDHKGRITGLLGVSTDITEVVELREQFKKLANTDSLSGAFSRRYWTERADHELERSRRTGGVLAIVLLDIDRFKSINDKYGHAIGDRAIQALAKACRSVMRGTDFLGRLGGDEFVVLACDSKKEGPMLLAERLRNAIEQAEVWDDGEQKILLTASFGVAVANSESTVEQLLARADSALYEAKSCGRNQIKVAL